MSLLRRAFRDVFTISKRRAGAGEGAGAVCEQFPSPGPGFVGSNLPFQIDNVPRLLCVYILYFASGFGLPFFAFRRMVLKASK